MRSIVAAVLLALASSSFAQQPPRPAVPVDAITGIIEAFRSHAIVALSDAHGSKQAQDFLISLVRDPRFAETVNDIVVEFGTARYQAVINRFVQGEDVPYQELRRVWRDTTQASAGLDLPIYEEFYRAVREVNRTLPPERKLRVLLGDPPIDWDRIQTRVDHRAWIEQREWYPAALIELEVLAKQRRALVVYGHGHFERKKVQANYENFGRLTDTIISLVEQATGTRAFIVWRDAGVADIQADAQTWKPPVIALIKGTTLGAADFGRYFAQNNDRLTIRDGKITPIPRSEWRQFKAEEQFDAVLYLGPPSSIVQSTWSPALCADQAYLKMRFARIALAGIPPAEADALKKHCASVTAR